MQDLNDLIPANSGWELSIATEISHDGQKIVGRGIINGQDHAFLLTLAQANQLLAGAYQIQTALGCR